MVPKSKLRFDINFFGDTSFQVTTPTKPGAEFSLGALGLRLLGDLSGSVDALTEVVLEKDKSEVEQLAMRWRYGPGTLEVGRFHTEIGYWNTAYHHGLWLQTPIERPHAVRFEDDGGLVPVHWVGAHYTLSFKPIAITFGVANGRGPTSVDVQIEGDSNVAKAALVKVRYKQSGVEVGIGAIYDRIAPADAMVRPALPNTAIDEYIGNAYLAIRLPRALVISEEYAFIHRAGGQSWRTLSGMGLVGVRVSDAVMPYAELDVIASDEQDPFFVPKPGDPSRDIVHAILGVRFDVSTWSALKLEARYTEEADLARGHEYALVANWSFGL